MGARKPAQLFFTDSEAANRLIAADPMALLVGFALDQQVTVQKAFSGPLVIVERIGSVSASALANADLEAVFREKPAVHRYPGAMAGRVHALAAHVLETYDGEADRVWKRVPSTDQLSANLHALPGFGDMKVVSLASVLARRFGVAKAEPLVPDHPTLGDVDSPAALAEYQAGKRAAKAAARAAKAAANA